MADWYGLWKGRALVTDELVSLLKDAEDAAALEYDSAMRIQRLFRGQFIRAWVERQRVASIKLERVYRGHAARLIAEALAKNLSIFEEAAVFHYHCIMVQRAFRGYYSRRYYHDYSARKKYIDSIKSKNEDRRATLAAHREALLLADEERAADSAKKEFEAVTQNLHHLVSTAHIAGIYNTPYMTEQPTAMGLPLEHHLRNGVKTLLRTRGYQKRGLVNDLNGSRRVPVRPAQSRLSVQASSHYDVPLEAERMEAKLEKMSHIGGRDFTAGQRVHQAPYRRGLNEGSQYTDPWRNPYMIRGIPKSQAELSQGRTSLGKAPAVHFHTSVGGNKSAVLPNDRFDVMLDAETSGGVHLRHKGTTARFGVSDTCDVRDEDEMFPPIAGSAPLSNETGPSLMAL